MAALIEHLLREQELLNEIREKRNHIFGLEQQLTKAKKEYEDLENKLKQVRKHIVMNIQKIHEEAEA